jgi:pyrroloquinoline quinone (PQQ) biosynthesis protein C
MNYRVLTDDHQRQLQQRKLAEVETEHAQLALDLRLAELVGIDNAEVAQARAQLDMLEAQHAALAAWLDREPACPDS